VGIHSKKIPRREARTRDFASGKESPERHQWRGDELEEKQDHHLAYRCTQRRSQLLTEGSVYNHSYLSLWLNLIFILYNFYLFMTDPCAVSIKRCGENQRGLSGQNYNSHSKT
jgi:hypothetical protein